MIFDGFRKTFSTVGDAQYDAIGAFWDELSARFGRERLQGLGCHWTENGLDYAIGLKEGTFDAEEKAPAGAERVRWIIPDHHWRVYAGETERLSELYADIYREGPLDFEIETFSESGACEVRVFRKAAVPDALDAIRARRSYRGRYCSAPVPLKDLRVLAQAGLSAPSGCNRQTTALAAVNTPEQMRAVLDVIDPPVAVTAPAGIFVLTRRVCAYRDKCFAVQDYAAAIENILIAAAAMGYASCWIEGRITDDDRICDRIAQVLGTPKDAELVCFLPLGIPETEAKAPSFKPYAERCMEIDCAE